LKPPELGLALLVTAAVCFGIGYMSASPPAAQQYAIGENVVVYVKTPGASDYTEVSLFSGATVLDAVANAMPIHVELYPGLGPAVKTVDNQWLLYTVNGEAPPVGMDKYQLKGGENIELSLA